MQTCKQEFASTLVPQKMQAAFLHIYAICKYAKICLSYGFVWKGLQDKMFQKKSRICINLCSTSLWKGVSNVSHNVVFYAVSAIGLSWLRWLHALHSEQFRNWLTQVKKKVWLYIKSKYLKRCRTHILPISFILEK